MNSNPVPVASAKPQGKLPPRSRLLSVDQTCASLGIGRTNFYGLKAAKLIATVKIGRRTFVTAEALDAFIASLSEGNSL